VLATTLWQLSLLLALGLFAGRLGADPLLEMVPAGMDWVLGAELERIVASPSFSSWDSERRRHSGPDDFVDFVSHSGLDLRRDVRRLRVGGQLGGGNEFVAVLEGDFEPEKLLAAWGERWQLEARPVGGWTFYRPRALEGAGAAVAGHELEFAFPDSKRLLLCSIGSAAAAAAVAQDGAPSLAQDPTMQAAIESARGSAMIWIVARMRPDAGTVLAANPFANNLRSVESLAFTMDLGEGVQADLRLRCADELEAGRLMESVGGLVALGRGLLAGQKPGAALAFEGLRVDREAAEVQLSLALGAAELATLREAFSRSAVHPPPVPEPAARPQPPPPPQE